MDDRVIDLSERMRQKDAEQAQEDAMALQVKINRFQQIGTFANQIFFNVVSNHTQFSLLEDSDLDQLADQAFKAANAVVRKFESEAEKEGLV